MKIDQFPPEARFGHGQHVCYSDTRLPIGKIVKAFKTHDGAVAYHVLQPSGHVTILRENHLMQGLPIGLASLFNG